MVFIKSESDSVFRKCKDIKLEHFPQYRSLIGDSLRELDADIGAEVAYIFFDQVADNCSYSILVDSWDRIKGGTELDLIGPEAFLVSVIGAAVFSLLELEELEEAIRAGPVMHREIY